MQVLKEYLKFDRLIMPYALQLLFWVGIGGTLFGSWWLFVNDNWAWVTSITFGPVLTRLIFESLIIRYKTYVYLIEIRNALNEKLES